MEINDMQKLLTIVVPVYKVEQYINKCLDSCILYREDGSLDEEKMAQLEVIIVNDGTPDRSAELSREYTVRYPQTFRQIDQENRGHGGAWNHGLKEATGKYLRFLDSDDWLTNLDKLMEKLADTDADLVFTPMRNVYAEGGEEDQPIVEECNLLKSIEEFPFIENPRPNIADFWFVTYKKCILEFEGNLFLEHCSYDDTILFVAPFIKATNYVVCDFVVYNYLIGREGQSVSVEALKRGMSVRLMNHTYMSQFYKRNKHFSRVKGKHIAEIVAGNVATLYRDINYLSYRESKRLFSDTIADIQGTKLMENSHQLRRYQKYPFCVFWLLEKLRSIKNKKK